MQDHDAALELLQPHRRATNDERSKRMSISIATMNDPKFEGVAFIATMNGIPIRFGVSREALEDVEKAESLPTYKEQLAAFNKHQRAITDAAATSGMFTEPAPTELFLLPRESIKA